MASSLTRKYARALLQVASQEDKEKQVQEDLASFGAALGEFSELAESLMSPAIPFHPKRRIVEKVARLLSLSRTTVNFILVLLENNRIGEYDEYVEAYQEAMDERTGISRGLVISALSLDSAVRSRLESAISAVSGGQVYLDYEEDEALIGGFKVRVGHLRWLHPDTTERGSSPV